MNLSHFWKNGFFTIFWNFPSFFEKMLRRKWKWQKFLPKTEISADPIFLRCDTKYHISDSFLTLSRIPRNCDKKYFFDVFKDYSVIWASFHFFLQFSHIFWGKSWQQIRWSSYKSLCLTAKSSYCHQKSLLRWFRTFFFDMKRKKIVTFSLFKNLKSGR